MAEAKRGRPKKIPDSRCLICDQFKKYTDFYMHTNTSRFKSQRMAICKECLKNEVYDHNGEVDVEEFKQMLMIIDMPFYRSEFESAVESDKETIGTYISNVYLNHKGEGYSAGDQEAIQQILADKFELNDEIIRFWGTGYTPNEYDFLNEFFIDLTDDFEVSDSIQERLIKAICKTELAADKVLMAGDMGKYNNLRKTISMILEDNNMKPKNNKGLDGDNAFVLGLALKKYEYDKPLPDPLPEWRKNDTIRSNIRTFFVGHLASMLGLQNDYAKEYEEELAKHTVAYDEVGDTHEEE